MRTFSYRSMAGVLILLAFSRAAVADGPAWGPAAKAGKAATALVEGQFRMGRGSAFCIHPSGIFITNEHVIAQQDSVSLVLNPGLKTAKVVPAKVVRVDKDLDLALLRVDGQKDLPALRLGADDELAETTELLAVGFPFGHGMPYNQTEHPAHSVNRGSVTSLRTKDGLLNRIQVDVALNPGNSGGPLLDKDGRVVGVVASGMPGAGVNFAIPVTHVSRFVARPEILFDPPVLKLASVHEPAEFQVRALALVPAAKPLELELTLDVGGKNARKFKMEASGELHHVTAVPVLRPDKPPELRLTALYPLGTVSGQVQDRVFRVGGSDVKLGSIRRLVASPKPRVWLREGKSLHGELAALEAVPVRLGPTEVPLDLTKAVEVRIELPAGFGALAGTVVARQEGKVVGRLTRFLTVQGVPEPGEEELFTDLEVAPLENDMVVRQLEAPIRDVAVGGGGRYLIMHLPRAGKLAIFDVNEAKVVKFLPLTDDGLKLAAGLDKLVVALPGSATVQRWDLTTFQQELEAPLPVKGQLLAMSMGAASHGPVVIYATEANAPWTTSFHLSLDKLERRDVVFAPIGHNHPISGQDVHVRSSLDGKAAGVWCTSYTPSGVTWIRWENQIARSTYSHSSNGHVIPGPGGKILFTELGMFTKIGMMPQDSQTYQGAVSGGCYLPSYDPAYYLALDLPPVNRAGLQFRPQPRVFQKGSGTMPDNRNSGRGVAIYKLGMAEPILRLPEVEIPGTDQQWLKHDFTLDKRFHLVPQAKVLIVISSSNDRLILYRVDVEEALEKMSKARR